ncbi:11517_t:CDS:2, partial [Gigaspora rosea]
PKFPSKTSHHPKPCQLKYQVLWTLKNLLPPYGVMGGLTFGSLVLFSLPTVWIYHQVLVFGLVPKGDELFQRRHIYHIYVLFEAFAIQYSVLDNGQSKPDDVTIRLIEDNG